MAVPTNTDHMFNVFSQDVRKRFRGRLIGIEKTQSIHTGSWHVRLIINIPEHEVADELEIYRRINKVIDVIAEGE